jgi:hypothetical protein
MIDIMGPCSGEDANLTGNSGSCQWEVYTKDKKDA